MLSKFVSVIFDSVVRININHRQKSNCIVSQIKMPVKLHAPWSKFTIDQQKLANELHTIQLVESTLYFLASCKVTAQAW